ncbi:uncharacterized protein LOC135941016 [Cloeon dipterum]|uniref:uncharacterized protein LOC135941016 n=1 Tax=Cloeon dipterum TaxID=197152 RepID=UPI0032201A4C
MDSELHPGDGDTINALALSAEVDKGDEEPFFADQALSEAMEQTIAETTMKDVGEEDVDEALRNLANLDNFDEFFDDAIEPSIPEAAPSSLSGTHENQSLDAPARFDAETSEVVLVECTSENVAPFVIKNEPVSDEEEMTEFKEDKQDIIDQVGISIPLEQSLSLVPNLPANFGLKSFDWEEPEKPAIPSSIAGQPFTIKIRNDLLQTRIKEEAVNEPDEKLEEPAKTLTETENVQADQNQEKPEERVELKASSTHGSSADSDVAAKEKHEKKVEKKKKAKETKKVSKVVNKKPPAVRSGIRLLEHGAPVQWLIDAVRIMLRSKHNYSAQDMDTCLDQLTVLPCVVNLRRLSEAEIKVACKAKKKTMEVEPPQNYSSSKMKVIRNEIVDLILAKEEMGKEEAKEQKKLKEQAKKRKSQGKEKEKKKKRQRLMSTDEDSDKDSKKSVKVKSKSAAVDDASKSVFESAEETRSEGSISRDSSVSRGEEKAKEKSETEKTVARSDSRNEEPVKIKKEVVEKADKDTLPERSNSRSEEKKDKEKKERKDKKENEKERELKENSKKQSKQEKNRVKKPEVPKPLQTPSFKIPKRTETSKPPKEFSILPAQDLEHRRPEKKVPVQNVPRVGRKAVTLERSVQTDPLSCMKNYSGPSVEDLMLLARQQIREAPIVLARWSRNPPVAAAELVRFQHIRQKKAEAEKAAREVEKHRETDRLKHKISVNDYKNRKYTPKPLSKMGQTERKHQETLMRREHRAHQDTVPNGLEAALPSTTGSRDVNSPQVEDVGQSVNRRLAPESDKPHASTTPRSETHHKQHFAVPKSSPSIAQDNIMEEAGFSPLQNSLGNSTPTQDELDLTSIVKTSSSFMIPTSQLNTSDIPANISLDERLRQTNPFLMQLASQKAAPSPVPPPVRAPNAQSSPRPSFFPLPGATPPQMDSSRSPALGNGLAFPYSSPNAFGVPQPVPHPITAALKPVPPPTVVTVPELSNIWNASNLLDVQDFDRQIKGHKLPSLFRDTSEEVSFWKLVLDEFPIPEFLCNRCVVEMKGQGCKVPRCPQLHELVSMSICMQNLSPIRSLECYLSIRQKQFTVYYQPCFEELLKKLSRASEARLLLCLCYEVMYREDELGPYWWSRLVEALLQVADAIRDDNAFELKRVLIYVMGHRTCTLMLRNEVARLSIRTYQHVHVVLNELFRDRDFVAHKSIVEPLIEHILLNKIQPWTKRALEILVANVPDSVWHRFKQGVIHELAYLCGESDRISLYTKSGRAPPTSAAFGRQIPTLIKSASTQSPAAPSKLDVKPPLPPPNPLQRSINPPLPPSASPLPPLPPEVPAEIPPPPPTSVQPPPMPHEILISGVDMSRPYSPSEKADDELDDPFDVEHNAESLKVLCVGHDKPELIRDLFARLLRAVESEDFARVTSIVLRHPGDKLPRGRILYNILKERMQRPSQGFLKVASYASVKSNAQTAQAGLAQKFHNLLGTIGINILLDLVDQDCMNEALPVYLTTKSMTHFNWDNVTSYRDSPISLEQILLKSCKMCFRMGHTPEAYDLLKKFQQTTGSRGSKDLLDVLELLIENSLNEHKYKETLLLWTHARDTKLKFCLTNNIPSELPKNTLSFMVRLLNNNDLELVLQLWKEMRDAPNCLDKRTTRAVVQRLRKINLEFALDAYNAGRLNSAYPPQMTNHRQVNMFSYWTYEEIYVIMEDVLRRLEKTMKGTDISDFSLLITLEELPEPPSSTDTIEEVKMPFVDNSLLTLHERIQDVLSKMNPPIVLNPRGDPKVKTVRANPVSLRCHLVQRRIRMQRQQQQHNMPQQQAS